MLNVLLSQTYLYSNYSQRKYIILQRYTLVLNHPLQLEVRIPTVTTNDYCQNCTFELRFSPRTSHSTIFIEIIATDSLQSKQKNHANVGLKIYLHLFYSNLVRMKNTCETKWKDFRNEVVACRSFIRKFIRFIYRATQKHTS